MSEPQEPTCPAGRLPHRQRIATIAAKMKEAPPGFTASVCIDNKPEHRAYYLHQLGMVPELEIVDEGELTPILYAIKVKRR